MLRKFYSKYLKRWWYNLKRLWITSYYNGGINSWKVVHGNVTGDSLLAFLLIDNFSWFQKIYFRWKLCKSRKGTPHVVFKYGGKIKLSMTATSVIKIMTPALVCTSLEINQRSSMVKSEIFLSSKNKRLLFSLNSILLYLHLSNAGL